MFSRSFFNRTGVISTNWYQIKRSAGHSKWSNIRHIKAHKDNQKAFFFRQKIRGIKVVLSNNGWITDPSKSPALAKAIESALRDNVPKDTVDNFLKKVKDVKEHPVEYRLRGPNECVLVITFSCTSVTENEMRTQIKKILKKSVLEVTPGFNHAFEKKGLIIAKPIFKEATMDDAEEAAIVGGAEEVRPEEDQTYRFLTDTKSLHQVSKYLSENNWDVLECALEDLPTSLVELSDSEMDEVKQALDQLQELPEFVKFVDNIA